MSAQPTTTTADSSELPTAVIATGGTISMLADPASGLRRPLLTGPDLAAGIRGLDTPLVHIQPYAIGSEDAWH
jgi:L-asparaginase/Glu-tRNA(Gln) amidotransferase subunit D